VGDVIEAAFYIRFEDIFLFSSQGCVDLLDGIMASPSWSETIAVWLKYRLPFWFQGHLC
jgi:hypothetical protein